jgi:DNA-binding YbaB/EbfC family protein
MSNPKMPDFNELMKQAQKLQGDFARAQEELAKVECDGAAGGGLVTATVNGQFEVVRVKIDKSVVDPNDVGMLEDLVTAAINAAAKKVRETSQEKMSQVMGPMAGMPGLPPGF